MQHITATLIAYLHTCRRKLWLHAHDIRLEHTSDLVAEGRLIGETAYERRPDRWTQLELDGIKIDFFDASARVVHETKRGRAVEAAHRAQVQFYLYKLRQHGISDASGLIEYPDLRRTEAVAPLDDETAQRVGEWEAEARRIIATEVCPPVERKSICRSCSFHDWCYIEEQP